MTAATGYVAIDLGAESGRVIVGLFDGQRIVLDEVHRFANRPVRLPDGLHWDLPFLYTEALVGLRAAAQRYGKALCGVGIDSWAVDYGLLDRGGRLLGLPYHYRDSRTDGVRELAASRVSAQEQYARTGIAQLPFNTLYQLLAQTTADDPILRNAASLLMIPDLLAYWLTGERAAEYTNATSTGMLGADGRWADDLLARLDIATGLLHAPLPAGTVLGPLRPFVREECGMGTATRVILPATHDTASAVMAVPAAGYSVDGRHAYISSGTWSLLGVELPRAVLTEEARLSGFTNEGGVGATYRLLTNIMGLWLVQECRRSWSRAGRAGYLAELSYEELIARAAELPSSGVIVDVDDAAFLHPQDMPTAIATQLRQTGQAVPQDAVVVIRSILEGLALAYRAALEQAERLSGTAVEVIHIVGGGARNSLLCQLTADACALPVEAGPVEATALGNILVQAMGSGTIADRRQAREVARATAHTVRYEPRSGAQDEWEQGYRHLAQLREKRRGAEQAS